MIQLVAAFIADESGFRVASLKASGPVKAGLLHAAARELDRIADSVELTLEPIDVPPKKVPDA